LKNVTNENKIYKRLEYLVILFTIIGVVITIIVSKIMSRRILKPINNVIKTAKSISTDDLSKRIEIPKEEDELQNLTLIINEMLDRLETSFENQKKFVSDASHELRTPLAIIKGYAEIIRKRGTTDIDIFVESIDSIISETDNMRNLIQKLLFLAKGEITKINTKFVDIDANEMVHQIHSDTVVSTKTHKFHLEMGEDYKIKGDETLLQQAIRALIENAAKYSEPNTNIYIKSFIKDGFGRISIRDEGVGISDEDAKRIFDRFYRVDLSRTKATGGTGLGLAIVKRIVEIHNGKIEVDSKMNEGTEISIVLPIGDAVVNSQEEINKNNGKCYLAVKNNKIIGLIMGRIFSYDEYDYLDYKCPKRGEITELIVTNKIRSKGIGQELINKMEEYFKSVRCEYVIVDVFAYNEFLQKKSPTKR